MKHYRSILILAAILIAASSQTRAQSLITHSVTNIPHSPNFSRGRDFWLVEMSNYWGLSDGNKYGRIYMTSNRNTIVYGQWEGKKTPFPISPYSVSSALNPDFIEMESSGEVEPKAIHVWSNDADLTVYTMSHNSYTTDGSYVIPTIGWGTDYVVAAAPSYFDSTVSGHYDLPSLMAVVADQDSTLVTITPSCNCRRCTSGTQSGDSSSHAVAFPSGQPQQFTLNRGQCVQLMPVLATAETGFDLSGTIVHASHPIGVFGGSVESNMPGQYPYSDRMEEMMHPVSSWGETYYTSDFFHRIDTLPRHDSAMYLLTSSVPNQTIYHAICGGRTDTISIPNKYGIHWGEEYRSGRFWSSEPFQCTEYSNSSLFPDSMQGVSDPSEASVTPRERFVKTVLFETPTSGNAYYNFVNVVVNAHDVNKTFIDSKPIAHFRSQCADSDWKIFFVDTLSAGAHIVAGDDSGVGVLVYGYGYHETYSWGAEGLLSIYDSPDTIPPTVTTSGDCYRASIFLSDSGMLPNGIDSQSKISEVVVDSFNNFTFLPYLMNKSFYIVPGQDTAGYGMYVTNIAKPGLLRINIFDAAGNETIVTSTYTPPFDTILPEIQDLGKNTYNSSLPNIAYDTLFNNGDSSFHVDTLQLMYGNRGFAIFDSTGGPLDRSPMPPHSRRLVQIQFDASRSTPMTDSIIFGTRCNPITAAVIGSGIGNDFAVSNQVWNNVPLPTPDTGDVHYVWISNLSTVPITIDSVWWADTSHFKTGRDAFGDTLTVLPITIPPQPSRAVFYFAFFPDTMAAKTEVAWFSKEVLVNGVLSPRFDTLIGSAVLHLDLVPITQSNSTPSVWSYDGEHISVILPENWEPRASVQIMNALGETVYRAAIPSSTVCSVGMLPAGVYFWRIVSDAGGQSGKIILNR